MPNQTKPNQTKPTKSKPNQTNSTTKTKTKTKDFLLMLPPNERHRRINTTNGFS